MILLEKTNLNMIFALCIGIIMMLIFARICFHNLGKHQRTNGYIFSVIEKILKFLDNYRFLKFLIPLIICIASIIAICMVSDGSFYILGTLVASLLFVKLIEMAGEIFYCFFEDRIKANKIKGRYINNYGVNLAIDNHQTNFLYKPLLIIKSENEKYTIEIIHKQGRYFKLSPFVISNFTSLLYAYRNDYVENFDCVRLDSFKIDKKNLKVILNTSEIKCFDHLVTNFALDYKLDKKITLRDVYEFGNTLPNLKDSLMANQIGINVLVFLKDGNLIMPKRGRDATISKNMVTSSIAMAYELKEEDRDLTQDKLLRKSIITGLNERLYLSNDVIIQTQVDIVFLGFGQVVVWGGKPQFYFCAWLDMDARQYIYNSINVNSKGKIIDKDKVILIVRDIELYGHGDYLKLRCLNEKSLLLHNKQKDFTRVYRAESSFFCNCYHLKECQMNDDRNNNWLKKKLS